MKALTFHDLRTIRHETVADPIILEPTDAIVAVERTAICGSDMHVWHGRERGLDRGTVMGHEFVGRIVDKGPAVRGLALDERVLSPFTTNCGTCYYCKIGLTARCERGELYGWVEGGRGLHGAQAELVRVPLADATLVPLPPGVSADEGLLLGDVLSTGYFCAKLGGVGPGGRYAIVGCGPVGLMAVVGARVLGAERIWALDTVTDRLERARAFGAEPIDVGDPTGDGAVAVIAEATDDRGADAVLEVVGSPEATRAAFDLVRPGGTIAAVGVHTEPHFSFSPTEAYDKNITYRIGRCPARSMLEELIPVVREKRFDPASIITHRLPLASGPEAYAMFDAKHDGCIKIVLEP